ncbi:unnamed protein product [marine sediment metagenome]|uniref:Zinc-ribbon domain-containing protein n=1 Tax=marine sediment metagenome TaxID=412755 RepID=X1C4M2_9ZZZZ
MIENYQITKQEKDDIFCPLCGKKIEEGQKVCEYCGSSME